MIKFIKFNILGLISTVFALVAAILIITIDTCKIDLEMLQWILSTGVQTMGGLLGFLLVGLTYVKTRADHIEEKIEPIIENTLNRFFKPWWKLLREEYFNQNINWIDSIDYLDCFCWGGQQLDCFKLNKNIEPPIRIDNPELSDGLSYLDLFICVYRVICKVNINKINRSSGQLEVYNIINEVTTLYRKNEKNTFMINFASRLASNWRVILVLSMGSACLFLGLTLLYIPNSYYIVVLLSKIFGILFLLTVSILINITEIIIRAR